MAILNFFKKRKILFYTSFITFTLIVSVRSLIFAKAKKQSVFEVACDKLGFSAPMEHEALLNIFLYEDYFTKKKLWETLNELPISGKEDIFNGLWKTIEKAPMSKRKSKNEEVKFTNDNIKYLKKNLMNNLTIDQAIQLIVCLSQNGYQRAVNMERSDLAYRKTDKLLKDQFCKLGIFNRIDPMLKEYDMIWIVGASRGGLIGRINFFKENKSCLKRSKDNNLFILTTEDREIFAEIDGLDHKNGQSIGQEAQKKMYSELGYEMNMNDSKTEDGKKYIKYLAEKNAIPLKKGAEVIAYQKDFNSYEHDLYSSRLEGRHYANYLLQDDDLRIVSERMMVQDLIDYYLSEYKVSVIKGYSSSKKARAGLTETISQAANELLGISIKMNNRKFKKNAKEIKLLIVSSNPYVKRHKIIAQRVIDRVIQKINPNLKLTMHVCGGAAPSNAGNTDNINMSVLLSELGGLILESYRLYLYNSGMKEVDVENICNKISFQGRMNNKKID